MDRLGGFEDNTWINGIGSVFKRADGSKWGINLSIYPRKTRGSDSVLLSQAPILIRKNVINPTRPFRRQGSEIEFTVDNLQKWATTDLESCPAKERDLLKERKSRFFVKTLPDGMTVYLPQFELARALFFHNAYFSRACMEHGILQNEFSVEHDVNNSEHAVITVLPNSTCPDNVFSDPGYRRYLAWLLLDDDARLSYESISKMQLESGFNRGSYRIWHFEFEPPPLQGVNLKVRGNLDTETNTLLVYEITELIDIPTDVPSDVEFFSPKFYVPELSGGRGGRGGDYRPPNHEVDEDQDSSGENDPVQIDGVKTKVEFAKAVNTHKTATKRKKVGSSDSSEGGEASSLVSTEEQSPMGDLPSAEWDGLDETTGDMHLYASKFESFSKMLDLLVTNHQCKVEVLAFRKLPSVGRCKMHLMRDDSTPRCWILVRATVSGNQFYLMEVDTSDAAKSLSTKVVMASSEQAVVERLSEIEIKLLKKSLSWPKDYFDSKFGKESHFFIVHQASDKAGVIRQASIERWAGNFHNHLQTRCSDKLG
ncbi:Tn7-like element transposition protein TnsE [uncultured Idiomarina sp.]|uniref:Tn7-like element transposition protein TnsE n=1 Tax=uncultured Idiomarina sp. TaxID=352961 RepID=UPI0032B171A0